MIYFLSSIPRSGSTLLSALLNQRTDTYVSTTSGLCDTMGSAITTWERNPATHAAGSVEEDGMRLLRSIIDAHYANQKEPIIIDKGRGWPMPPIMSTMAKVQGDIKIIATVRPIRECLASFVKVAKPDNVKDFCKNSELANHLFSSYHALKAGYEASPENFLLIEYNDLVKDPQKQLDRVADFLNIARQDCDPENVSPVQEDDKIWGIKDLHKVRPKVRKRSIGGKKLLGNELWDYYIGGEFWNDKPEPKKKHNLLDDQVQALFDGEYEKAWEIAEQLERERPEDNRAAFNRGWYLMRMGKLLEGHKLLDRGREEDVFGNRPIGSHFPIWHGESDSIVLMNLEAGIGDQLHNVKYAKDIAAKGNRVVVSCSSEVAEIVKDAEGVSAVVQHEAALGVYHDFWVPAMSAVVSLDYEFEDLDGSAFLPCPTVEPHEGFRIGLRWQGNPKFEHAQKRLFPPELLFDAVKGFDCISLQKGEGEQHKPDWVREVSLDTWVDTAKAIASCDLVISSCTAIAHLAGGMGVQTWTVVPFVPYYLWSLPGEKTPHYDSMTLFRQSTVKDWISPFEEIAERLEGYREA